MLSNDYARWTVWAVLMGFCPGMLCCQAQDSPTPRENMKQPVYRVGHTKTVEARNKRMPRSARPQSDPSPVPVGQPVPQRPLRPDAGNPTAAGTLKHPNLLDALDDADKCLQSIRSTVHDYTCLLVRREMVNGVQLEPEHIQTKIRHRAVQNGRMVVPFSIYMKVLKPDKCKGREILYVEGANKGKMLVKEGGFRGRWLPSIWLSTTSPLVTKHSRYPITDAGIENLTLKLLERGRADDGLVAEKDYTVEYRGGAMLDGRSCRYLKMAFFAQTPVNDVSLIEVFIDEGLLIPVRYIAHGWPTGPGASPPVLEEYTYLNLKLNCGLTDRDFSSKNPNYGF